jgi:protein ImuB
MLPLMSDTPPRSARPINRRILSLWFPRLAAERVLRAAPALAETPLAVVGETGNLREIVSLNRAASARGLRRGQALTEAVTLCPDLLTRPHEPQRDAQALAALRRWAGRFSPWVAEEGAEALLIDLTGCAHLFGGEEALFAQVHQDCADLGLTVRAGIADTAGAAWALARYAGGGGVAQTHGGDAIDQEARATRSRAEKRRHWTRGGAAPEAQGKPGRVARISPPGGVRQSLSPLPIAALRVPPDITAGLARLGLRRIGDLWGMPRAGLARRFGRELVRRLDQALGVEPEPISPAGAPLHFAMRLTLPEPIGLEADILAGLDRLLPPLCEKLRARGRGARRLRLEMLRAEGGTETVEVGLARPADRPDSLRPLFELKLGGVEAGFGFDVLRLVATVTEPLHATEHKGGWAVAAEARAGRSAAQAFDDLIARIGARVGLERITREHPTDSHIPEKTSATQAAAYSAPAADWPETTRPRPLTLFRPEPVTAPDDPTPPVQFRWRGRVFETRAAHGPERIAPEWWLDDPNWRTGVRDYWRVVTTEGHRLWLFYAHGGAASGGWFAQGDFG